MNSCQETSTGVSLTSAVGSSGVGPRLVPDYLEFIALGPNEKLDRVIIEWPSGHSQIVEDLPAGEHVIIEER